MADASASPTNTNTSAQACLSEGYKLYLVMSTPNACLPENERLASFKKGLLTQLFFNELRAKGLVLEQRNLVVLCVGRPNGVGSTADDETESHTIAPLAAHTDDNVLFCTPSRQDEIHWDIATRARLFSSGSVVVMMRLSFTPDDLPVGATRAEYLSNAVKSLNAGLLGSSSLATEMRPKGKLEVLLTPLSEPELADHENYQQSVDFQTKMAATQHRRENSHVTMVSTLHDLRQIQTAMIQAVRAGNDLRDFRKVYLEVEGEMLRIAKVDIQTQSACMREEIRVTESSLEREKAAYNRLTVRDCIEAVEKANPPLTGLKRWAHSPLPSEQAALLKSTHSNVNMSSFELAGLAHLLEGKPQEEEEEG